MTHTDYTKNILNIKDENIYFYENYLENRKINGNEVKVFHMDILLIFLNIVIDVA